MKKDKCIIKIENRFLFWKWTEEKINHDWGYINNNKQKRKRQKRNCLKCGRAEIYFGEYYNGNYWIEDWRPLYKKS